MPFTYKTCPNENCENHEAEFDTDVNYCSACGTLLILAIREEDDDD